MNKILSDVSISKNICKTAMYESFSINMTNLCKGIACILLLCHHLFSSDTCQSKYVSIIGLITDSGNYYIQYFAILSKVCVNIFLVLSGYGLFVSRKKSLIDNSITIKGDIIFLLKHLLKLMKKYWLIFLLFVPVGFEFGRTFSVVYPNAKGFELFSKILCDFCGLSYLFFPDNTNTFNVTWWFMSAIIVCYLLFPILYRIINYDVKWSIAIAIIVLVVNVPFVSSVGWNVAAFLIGMVLAKLGILNKYIHCASTKKQSILNVIWSSILLVGSVMFMHNYKALFMLFFAVAVICFCISVFAKIKYVNIALSYIGKHSGNIFMFHTFIYYYYFNSFIYSAKYPVLIVLLLLVICIIASIIVEFIMKYIDKAFSKIISTVKSKRVNKLEKA